MASWKKGKRVFSAHNPLFISAQPKMVCKVADTLTLHPRRQQQLRNLGGRGQEGMLGRPTKETRREILLKTRFSLFTFRSQGFVPDQPGVAGVTDDSNVEAQQILQVVASLGY